MLVAGEKRSKCRHFASHFEMERVQLLIGELSRYEAPSGWAAQRGVKALHYMALACRVQHALQSEQARKLLTAGKCNCKATTD